MISLKSEYGLLALADIAANNNGKPVQRSEIAGRQRIPLPYLTQVLRSLVNGDLLTSNRGPLGGYTLRKQPEEISVLDVVTLLQGPLSPVSCAGIEAPGDCIRHDDCGLVGIWSDLKNANEDLLRRTTLKDIVNSDNGKHSGITSGVAAPEESGEADAAFGPTAGSLSDEPAGRLDCMGISCPLPIVKIAEKMRELSPGEILEVWADDKGAKADVPAWCTGTGNEFISREEFGDQMKFLIRKVH